MLGLGMGLKKGCKPNNPNGRPKGSRNVLPLSVRKCIEVARQAEKLGICTDEAMGLVIQVMRGEVAHRHLRDRLHAAIWLLEQQLGKAKQKLEVDVNDQRDVYQAEFATGQTLHPAAAEKLPN